MYYVTCLCDVLLCGNRVLNISYLSFQQCLSYGYKTVAAVFTPRVSDQQSAKLCYAACSHICKLCVFLFFVGATVPSVPGLPHCQGFTITLIHTTLSRTSLVKWSARHGDLYLTTHNTVKRPDIHAPSRIWTLSPSKRTAADPYLRPRSHWDWLNFVCTIKSYSNLGR